ncbi:MAG: helix-turn-helix transcriptional regulator [Syntrophothermus sp.]
MRVKIVAIDNRLREALEELSAKRGESFVQTLAYVSEAAGVSQEYLYKIMAGKRHPSQKVLFALAYILNKPVETLFLPRIKTEGR